MGTPRKRERDSGKESQACEHRGGRVVHTPEKHEGGTRDAQRAQRRDAYPIADKDEEHEPPGHEHQQEPAPPKPRDAYIAAQEEAPHAGPKKGEWMEDRHGKGYEHVCAEARVGVDDRKGG